MIVQFATFPKVCILDIS